MVAHLCSCPLESTADLLLCSQLRITMRPMLGIVPVIGAIQVLLSGCNCRLRHFCRSFSGYAVSRVL